MRTLAVLAALTVTAAGLMAGGGPARAESDTPPAINPDVLTISGRYGLPKAMTLVTEKRLRVGTIKAEPPATDKLSFTPSDFQTALQQGLSKSLNNHGLLADADGKDPVVLQVEMPAITFAEAPDADGKPGSTTAHAVMRITAPGADPALAACVNYEAQGEFKVWHRQKSGDGKRTAGVVAMVVIAAINPYAINTFSSESFVNADLENRNLNAQRTVSSNEGISPGFDAKANQSYAALNATQLAIYNYLHHQLQDNPACLAPQPAPQQVSDTKPADAPAAPATTPAVETTPAPTAPPETKAPETTTTPAATPAVATPPAAPVSAPAAAS